MQVPAGQAVTFKITPLNQDGTPQGPPIVQQQVIPTPPSAGEPYHVTRYQFEVCNSDRPTQNATVENPITVVPVTH